MLDLKHQQLTKPLLKADPFLSLCVSDLNSQEEDLGQFDPVEPLEESTTSLVSSSTSAYSSFPVDVVVYVRVQVTYLRLPTLLWPP